MAYLPCIYCFRFFKAIDLWRHTAKCASKPASCTEKQIGIKAKAKLLLSSSLHNNNNTEMQTIKLNLIDHMRKDDVFSALAQDKLILRLGSILYNKLRIRRKNDIAQRLRQMGRLIISCEATQLVNLISGKGFDRIINGVLKNCSNR